MIFWRGPPKSVGVRASNWKKSPATETEARAQRGLQTRLGRFCPMANFDWHWPKKIDRALIERAFTLDFLAEARSLILLGSNGVGKTRIAKNLAHQALLAGHTVWFRSAAELLADLGAADSPPARRRKLKSLALPHPAGHRRGRLSLLRLPGR